MNAYGRFGQFGGMYVPESLVPALLQLERAFEEARADPGFTTELAALLEHYAGRPTPLTECRNFCSTTPVRVFLKREDLLHGGAHKTNQVLAQALLAQRMGKRRVIAETGAGQHGVATALACALFGIDCRIYMGEKDCARQRQNLHRMRLLGAEVVPVTTGSGTLKDAVNEALRDWAASYPDTHYLLGTAAGPHPFPTMVREFQRVIGRETRAQVIARTGRLPDMVVACVGGGSNAIGMFADFIDDTGVRLVGVEAAGTGVGSGRTGATLATGRAGVLHGAYTFVLQDSVGQIAASHSISAGLDYPAVGPEHAYLRETGRAEYVAVTDDAAVMAFRRLCANEGIIPALESAHALAWVHDMAHAADRKLDVVVCLSGRGDKDLATVSGASR